MDFEIVKFSYENMNIEIHVSSTDRDLYLSLEDMALLFDRDRSSIGKQVRSALRVCAENGSVCAKFARTGKDGKRYLVDYYNMIIINIVGLKTNPKILDILKDWSKQYFDIRDNTNSQKSLIRFEDDGVSLDVTVIPGEETVYLRKEQMLTLFETSRQNIEYHITNIYESGELDQGATCKEILQVQFEGDRQVSRLYNYYNLDLIISLGFRVNTKRGIVFRKWANRVLKNYLVNGYAIDEKRALVTNENYLNLINKVDSLDTRLTKVENYSKYLLFEDKIVYESQLFDALVIMNKILEPAKESIILIDPYVDIRTLNVFKNKNDDVELTIITSELSKLTKNDIVSFNKQYGNLNINYDNRYHDRYLIIDGILFYHFGASINYLGKKFSQITMLQDDDIKEVLNKRIFDCK